MYSLQSAIARPIKSQGRWRNISLGDMKLSDAFAQYDRILATLTNPVLKAPVCLDLEKIRAAHGTNPITFNAFLVQNGSKTLATTNVLPTFKTRYARYADAFRAGYKVQPVHPTAAPSAIIPESEKTWLHLTRPDTDYGLFYRSCLVSVNGFIHATDASDKGVWVQDGMVSRNISRRNQIGLLSFNGISKLSFVPIKPNMLYKLDSDQKYCDRVHVDLGQDVSKKAVLLVLGGYLHVLDPRTFYRISNSGFAINFSNLAFVDRFFESKHFIDLSSLGVDEGFHAYHVAVKQLLSDEVIAKYMTLSQSFFVLLDNPEIFLEQEVIRTAPMPGMYVSQTKPEFPLMSELGKMMNYWYSYEDGQYSVVTTDAYRDNPIYRTVGARSATSITNHRDPVRPVRHSDMRYMKIGSDV